MPAFLCTQWSWDLLNEAKRWNSYIQQIYEIKRTYLRKIWRIYNGLLPWMGYNTINMQWIAKTIWVKTYNNEYKKWNSTIDNNRRIHSQNKKCLNGSSEWSRVRPGTFSNFNQAEGFPKCTELWRTLIINDSLSLHSLRTLNGFNLISLPFHM